MAPSSLNYGYSQDANTSTPIRLLNPRHGVVGAIFVPSSLAIISQTNAPIAAKLSLPSPMYINFIHTYKKKNLGFDRLAENDVIVTSCSVIFSEK